MTENTEALPCPFSPEASPEGLEVAKNGHRNYNVSCSCGAMGPDGDTEAEAIAAWNRRAPSPVDTQAEPVALPKEDRETLEMHRKAASEGGADDFSIHVDVAHDLIAIIDRLTAAHPPRVETQGETPETDAQARKVYNLESSALSKMTDLARSLERRLRSPTPASDYDAAVAALAPYLPDGWVAQDYGGDLNWYHDFDGGKPKMVPDAGYWRAHDGSVVRRINLEIPLCEDVDWHNSLRRIQGGRVGGGEP